ncbi:lantibiotic dehydratase [Dactylosporangium cerinum]|uniref:Lantibiotic dehydratase n=1 Tax=Dactylosporangium cerinum TaxID=1434730 RepID=A0ABV9WGR6_9ACTN
MPKDMDLSDDTAVAVDGAAWLAKIWDRPDVRDAVEIASPGLAAQIYRIVERCGVTEVKQLRGAIVSLTGYLLRWQQRATPFGLFAGVALAATGPAGATFGAHHHVVAAVDYDWLSTVITRLEQHPDLRRRLMVVADNTGVVRGGRYVTSRRIGPEVAGATVPLREASVRHTAPVRAVLALASAPIRLDGLAAALAGRLPAAPAARIDALLEALLDQGALITNLRPPMTVVDGLTHVIDTVTAAGGQTVAEVGELLRDLVSVRDLLSQHNASRDPADQSALRAMAIQRMRAVSSSGRHVLSVDTRLDAHIRLPDAVLTEAVMAANVLLRLSTKPFGSTAWQDYRTRFRARYGPGALVPVRDLVADSGLGFPTGFLGAPRAHPSWRGITERDAVFLALVQQALLDGRDQISLTDTDIAALTVGDPAEVIPPARVELGVTVQATSIGALDRGEFRLRFAAAPGAPTSMAGRFIALFDDPDRARLAAACAPTASDPSAVPVQLSFPPRRVRNENVTRVPQLLPDVVSLAEHPTNSPSDSSIGLDDLAVTADTDQMYLVQVSTGRRVVVHIPHALDTVVQSPPLARFLAEVGDARTAVFGPFDPGAARVLPYLPRIRYRRTTLAAARWLLTTTDLQTQPTAGQAPDQTTGQPGLREGADSGWDAALARWQRRWRVPARVVCYHGESRQPLNLDQRLDRALLRSQLANAGRVELHEDADVEQQGWIGRPAEFLIPLTSQAPARRTLPPLAQPARTQLPGQGTIIQARLAGNPARFDDLVRRLPALTGPLHDLASRWWIRRQRDLVRHDADQHLVIVARLRTAEHHAAVAAALAQFSADATADGLPGMQSLVPYTDHPGRYGTELALEAAEEVFAADTACVIAQITAAEADVPAQALAAASMARLAAAFADDDISGHQALLRCLPQQHGPLDRTLLDRTLQIAESPPQSPTATTPTVGDTWHVRDSALRNYFAILATQRDPASVLPTLLRDHHARALGIEPSFEQTTNRLARAIALRAIARITA